MNGDDFIFILMILLHVLIMTAVLLCSHLHSIKCITEIHLLLPLLDILIRFNVHLITIKLPTVNEI